MLRQIKRTFEHSPKVLGPRRVDCEVSSRWLAFGPTSKLLNDGRDMIHIDVMTYEAEGEARRLAGLIIDRAALEAALANVRRE